MPDWDAITDPANKCADENDADVVFYNGVLESPFDRKFLRQCRSRQKRSNVLFILISSGGDAHATYRIGRGLQRYYKKVTIFIPGWCKSAATLLAVSAHEIIVDDFGEFGPIDVQRAKQDELWESSSGLTEEVGMDTLHHSSVKMFEEYLFEIKALSGGQVTFKTAADVAATIVTGAFAPIYAQINPLNIGENARAMRIAQDYGMRLNIKSKNLSGAKSMEMLVSGYSSHGFVIDREEVSQLFVNVSEPSGLLEEICTLLGDHSYVPVEGSKPIIRFLSDEAIAQSEEKESDDAAIQTPAEPGETAEKGAGGDVAGDMGGPATAAAAGSESNVSRIDEASATPRTPRRK